MNIIECGEQGSDTWKAARLGKVTASRICDIMAKTKTGYSTSRANYRAALIVERLTGAVQDGFTNSAMKHGTDTEPLARAAYEFYRDVDVATVAFVAHPTIAMAGCSPDGLVGEDGLVEFKCPQPATHLETLLGAEIDGKYVKQMQFQMAVTGRAWCDFCSFDPRFSPEMQLHVRRVARDDVAIAEIEKEVRGFLIETAEKEATLRKQYLSEAAAA